MPERGDLDRKCPWCGGPGDPYCGLCERDGNLPANYWNTPTITCECIEYEDGSLDISQTCPIHVVTYVSAETLAAMEASPIEPHLPYVRAMRELFGKELP